MKSTLKIDFENKTIKMNRTFAKLVEDTYSEEYKHLQEVRKQYPDYRVIRRTIKRNPNKECYRGLTYEYMESYIATHDDEENSIRKEYDELRLLAKCHSIRYPNIKAWFLNQFPEIESFGRIKDTKPSGKVESTLSIVEKPLNEKVA